MISSRLVASILAASNDDDIDNRIMPEMTARTLRFRLPQRKKSGPQWEFCKRLDRHIYFVLRGQEPITRIVRTYRPTQV